MKNLKEKSLESLTNKLNECKTIPYFKDESGERKRADINKYTGLLSFAQNQPESYFEKYERLANATVTYYGAFGHNKAAMNEAAMKEELQAIGGEMPDEAILLSFGGFNGEGAV